MQQAVNTKMVLKAKKNLLRRGVLIVAVLTRAFLKNKLLVVCWWRRFAVLKSNLFNTMLLRIVS